MDIDVGCGLDIFEMQVTVANQWKKCITHELMLFKVVSSWFKGHIKGPLQWWNKHETIIFVLGLLAQQISSIVYPS